MFYLERESQGLYYMYIKHLFLKIMKIQTYLQNNFNFKILIENMLIPNILIIIHEITNSAISFHC